MELLLTADTQVMVQDLVLREMGRISVLLVAVGTHVMVQDIMVLESLRGAVIHLARVAEVVRRGMLNVRISSRA